MLGKVSCANYGQTEKGNSYRKFSNGAKIGAAAYTAIGAANLVRNLKKAVPEESLDVFKNAGYDISKCKTSKDFLKTFIENAPKFEDAVTAADPKIVKTLLSKKGRVGIVVGAAVLAAGMVAAIGAGLGKICECVANKISQHKADKAAEVKE